MAMLVFRRHGGVVEKVVDAGLPRVAAVEYLLYEVFFPPAALFHQLLAFTCGGFGLLIVAEQHHGAHGQSHDEHDRAQQTAELCLGHLAYEHEHQHHDAQQHGRGEILDHDERDYHKAHGKDVFHGAAVGAGGCLHGAEYADGG